MKLEQPDDSTFAALDAAPPYQPSLDSRYLLEQDKDSAQRLLREATTQSSLSPSQLALLAHSLPPDERCWLFEGLCTALRNANEKITHITTMAELAPPQPAGPPAEVGELKAKVAALQSEIVALRAREMELAAMRAWPSLSSTSRSRLLANHIAAMPTAPFKMPGAAGACSGGSSDAPQNGESSAKGAPVVPEASVEPMGRITSGLFDPWRGMPSSSSSSFFAAAPTAQQSSFFEYHLPVEANRHPGSSRQPPPSCGRGVPNAPASQSLYQLEQLQQLQQQHGPSGGGSLGLSQSAPALRHAVIAAPDEPAPFPMSTVGTPMLLPTSERSSTLLAASQTLAPSSGHAGRPRSERARRQQQAPPFLLPPPILPPGRGSATEGMSDSSIRGSRLVTPAHAAGRSKAAVVATCNARGGGASTPARHMPSREAASSRGTRVPQHPMQGLSRGGLKTLSSQRLEIGL